MGNEGLNPLGENWEEESSTTDSPGQRQEQERAGTDPPPEVNQGEGMGTDPPPPVVNQGERGEGATTSGIHEERLKRSAAINAQTKIKNTSKDSMPPARAASVVEQMRRIQAAGEKPPSAVVAYLTAKVQLKRSEGLAELLEKLRILQKQDYTDKVDRFDVITALEEQIDNAPANEVEVLKAKLQRQRERDALADSKAKVDILAVQTEITLYKSYTALILQKAQRGIDHYPDDDGDDVYVPAVEIPVETPHASQDEATRAMAKVSIHRGKGPDPMRPIFRTSVSNTAPGQDEPASGSRRVTTSQPLQPSGTDDSDGFGVLPIPADGNEDIVSIPEVLVAD